MKTIKSALLGNKQLVNTNADVLLIQLKEIIKEHRALVITWPMSALPTYLHYTFYLKTSRDIQMKVKEELELLKDGSVDLKAYNKVFQQMLSLLVIHFISEPFIKRSMNAC